MARRRLRAPRSLLQPELAHAHRGLGAIRDVERVVDVLDVGLCGLFGDAQDLRDLAIGETAREQAQHLDLSLGQAGTRSLRSRNAIQQRGHVYAAGQHAAQRLEQDAAARRLRDEARGAAFERDAHVHRALRAGEHDDRDVRMLAAQRLEGGEAAHAGQPEVEQHEIEAVLFGAPRQSGFAVADAGELGRGAELSEDELEPLSKEGVVVADQDPHVAAAAPATYVGSLRSAREVVFARLGRADKLLLGLYLPAYLAVVALHAHEVARSGLAQLPVFVRPVPGDYPRVAGHPVETHSSGSGLEPGDRLIQLGERDLRGVGYVGFQAIGLARTKPGRPAPLVFERAGERRTVALEARPHVHPWSRLPLLLLIPLVSVLLLLRAPASAGARRIFLAGVTYGFAQAEFYGGPEWKSWLAALALNVSGTLAIATVLHWARRFPDEMPESRRVWAGLPWLAALLYLVLVRSSYLLGGPIPSAWIARVSFASHAAAIASALVILAWNYAHAFAAGRRRLRWILLGALLGSVPFVAALLAPLVAPGWEGFEQAFALGFLGTLIWVSGIVLAVVRENAFDVDRLLSATAAWSLAAGAAVVALAVAVPAAATGVAGLASLLGVAPLSLEVALALLLGALVVPLGTRLRPRVDELLFPGHQAPRGGAERLAEELMQCRSDDELLALAAQGSARVLDATGFALYRAGFDGFRCSLAAGIALPARLPPATPLPTRLAPDKAPAELAAGGAALWVPLRLENRVDALLCLGA